MTKNYAIIENNVIVNVIVADEDFIANYYPGAIVCPDGFGIGDKFIDNDFVKVSIGFDEPLP